MVILMWYQVMCEEPGMSVSEIGSADWTKNRERALLGSCCSHTLTLRVPCDQLQELFDHRK